MPKPGTKSSAPPVAHAARSGGAGAAITDQAWPKYEPGQKTIRGIVFPAIGCGASSCWVSVSWREASTGRWPNCRSGRSRVLSDQWRSPAHSMNRFTALGAP